MHLVPVPGATTFQLVLAILAIATRVSLGVKLPRVADNRSHVLVDDSQGRPSLKIKSFCDGLLGICGFGPKRLLCITCRVTVLWDLAAKEDGIARNTISDFGLSVPKLPRSWVQRVAALDHTKQRNFNFVGRLYKNRAHGPAYRRRVWVEPFARKHFGLADTLSVTDAMGHGAEHVYTLQSRFRHGDRMPLVDRTPMANPRQEQDDFDPAYFAMLASSNFTLCPGGDSAYSLRFYEAILAGSIPVLNSKKDDLGLVDITARAIRSIGYHYIVNASAGTTEFKFRQDWANDNLRLFMKYQTFVEGDNVPKAYHAKKCC